ncbi:hypothetical protein PSU4_45530 [Pseudonocardia sulfidoxydans NBRC 16205]|uniref:Uncharacterized protein n=1 Tax=Pseudonocardia sulfidoxydans NBRC 16205 TaxID=1223511 RepID=A0A511DLC1_9PSEU|nr:hypothetical protein PSU4_45530 [Pseudonocardia sulfidoxydans NBRC 16205]
MGDECENGHSRATVGPRQSDDELDEPESDDEDEPESEDEDEPESEDEDEPESEEPEEDPESDDQEPGSWDEECECQWWSCDVDEWCDCPWSSQVDGPAENVSKVSSQSAGPERELSYVEPSTTWWAPCERVCTAWRSIAVPCSTTKMMIVVIASGTANSSAGQPIRKYSATQIAMSPRISRGSTNRGTVSLP